MEKLTKITAPAGEKLRQLQKMMVEIKTNKDSGFMQKIKRITNKPPPSVPRRDYVTGPQDDETDDWSDEFGSDYENPDDHSDREETYVDPTEEQDDESYEPPPNEQEPRFTPSYKFTDRNGGYAEKDRNQCAPNTSNAHMDRPTRPLPKPKETLPKPPTTTHQVNNRLPLPSTPLPKPLPKPPVAARHQPTSLLPPVMKKPVSRPQHQDDEDYIMPGDEEDDDNYIEPTSSPEPSKPPIVNRGNKPGHSPITRSTNQPTEPDHYEVPENVVRPTPPAREVLPLPRKNSPPKQEQMERFENFNESTGRRPEPPIKPAPSPLPRNLKPLLPKQKSPGLPSRDVNSNVDKPPVIERQRIQSAGSDAPPIPPTRERPQERTNQYVINHSRHGSVVEQDAKVIDKEWYSSSCDRKQAEEALQKSSKDGSYLVRRSTGQDQKQPFTLVVLYKQRVYNIPVRYIEATQQYALGREKSGEEKFSSVAEMVESHQRLNLVLIDSQANTKYQTKLKHPVIVL